MRWILPASLMVFATILLAPIPRAEAGHGEADASAPQGLLGGLLGAVDAVVDDAVGPTIAVEDMVGPIAQPPTIAVQVQTPVLGVEACTCGSVEVSVLGPSDAAPEAGQKAGAASGDASSPRGPSSGPIPRMGQAAREHGPEAAAWTLAVGTALALAKWLGLGAFSRIASHRVLDHPARRLLMEFIAANPGATLREAQVAAGVAWGTAVHHLRRLAAAGLVVSTRAGGVRRHWDATDPSARHRDAHAALASPASQRLAAAVLARPGATQADLARNAGVPAYVASRGMRRLADAGLVVAEARRWSPTPELATLLA